MPEGDTIWHTARRLRDALAGRTLVHADLRVPRHATVDLRGRVVGDVVARGKHLLVRIEPDLTVHAHLGLAGSFRVSRSRGRVPSPNAAAVRVIFATEDWLAVGSDLLRVDVVATVDESRLVGHLGPDLLGADWDPDTAVRNLSADLDRTVAAALLDQRNLAGIGNVYRNELLFLRGIHPAATVRDAGDLDRLVRLAHRLLWFNRDTPARVTTGDRRADRRHWVYGRGGDPCRRCDTPIRSGRAVLTGEDRSAGEDGTGGANGSESDRLTYWCPHCQPRGQPTVEPRATE